MTATLPGRFAAELKRAMTRRGIGPAALARALPADPTSVSRWRSGQVPIHPTVVAIAEMLDAPALVAISLEARTGACEVCGAVTVNVGRHHGPARYCTARCNGTALDRRYRGSTRPSSAVVRRALDRHQQAVAAFCSSCEPDGICRNGDCDLRSVSGLPFIPMSKVGRRVA